MRPKILNTIGNQKATLDVITFTFACEVSQSENTYKKES